MSQRCELVTVFLCCCVGQSLPSQINSSKSSIADCSGNPCAASGVCSPNAQSGYSCRCDPGFTTDPTIPPTPNCKLQDPTKCESAWCQNGGACVGEGNDGVATCSCRPGFTGRFCEQSMTPSRNGTVSAAAAAPPRSAENSPSVSFWVVLLVLVVFIAVIVLVGYFCQNTLSIALGCCERFCGGGK